MSVVSSVVSDVASHATKALGSNIPTNFIKSSLKTSVSAASPVIKDAAIRIAKNNADEGLESIVKAASGTPKGLPGGQARLPGGSRGYKSSGPYDGRDFIDVEYRTSPRAKATRTAENVSTRGASKEWGSATPSSGSSGKSPSIGNRLDDALSKTKKYYTGGTAEENMKRRLVTAGAAGVAAGAVRAATGGTMTENGRGERDIAGIPFI